MLERLIEVLIYSSIFGAIIAAGIFKSTGKADIREMGIYAGGALALTALIPAVFYVLFGVTVSR